MSAADDHEPIRSCIGCRQRHRQAALVRVTKSAGGVIVDGPSCGRGAWLCREPGSRGAREQCVEAALSRRAFSRAWRVDVSADDERSIRLQMGLRTDNGDESDAQ